MPVEAVFFNVGQGDCTLLIFYADGKDTQGVASVLIDCGSIKRQGHKGGGPLATAGSMSERVIEKIDGYLKNLKTPNTIDYLILSHPDRDHYRYVQDLVAPVDTATKKRRLRYTIRNIRYTGKPGDYTKDILGHGKGLNLMLKNWTTYGRDGSSHTIATEPVEQDMPATPLLLPLDGLPDGPTTPKLYVISASVSKTRTTASVAAKKRRTTGSTLARLEALPHGFWPLGGSKRKADAPTAESQANTDCIVLMLQGAPDKDGKRQKVILTADAGEETEDYLVARYKDDPDLKREAGSWLKVGHHGSANSSTAPWVRLIDPDGLLVSSGTREFGGTGIPRFGHLQQIADDRHKPAPTVTPNPADGELPRVAYYGQSGDVIKGTGPYHYRDQVGVAGVCTTLNNVKDAATGKKPDPRGWDWHLTIDPDGTPGTYRLTYK
ncbi:ComEC/Rec2 family competence protein [Kitasatospora sp. NPDC056076]|uniref:ComEC/Rec2 family competence protein n=1 Tax=Kitasatospora sp. NPDC056076 TaxID=3345703 RepID=UPI0035DBC0C4